MAMMLLLMLLLLVSCFKPLVCGNNFSLSLMLLSLSMSFCFTGTKAAIWPFYCWLF